jgi:lipopolysaccharide export system permease protein
VHRYITAEFLKIFAICLAGFIMVFLLVEMTDKMKLYFQHSPSGVMMVKYFLVKVPGYLFYAIPLAILMGGMLSLMMMARNSEIIAMQANGIDALSVARPVLLIGVLASLIMFVANETVIPWSNSESERIQRVIEGKEDTTFFKRDQIWMRSPDSIILIQKFDKSQQTLERVSIVRWNGNYDFTERIFADKAKWWDKQKQWVFYGINRTTRTPDGKFHVDSLPSAVVALKHSPADFDRVEKVAKEMNLTQLGDYIDKLTEEGQAPTRYVVDWHDKISFPLVCLIMAALSVPFAVRVNPRGGGVAVGLALSLIVAFSYWIVHTMFIALGHGGYIPPILAAWAANVVFGLTATILLLQAGT